MDWDFHSSGSDDEASNPADDMESMDLNPNPDTASSSSSNSATPPPDDSDPWSGFNEFQDLDKPLTLEQMMRNLDDMVGPDEAAMEWDEHLSSFDLPVIVAYHGHLVQGMQF
ncbi:hypothetical protein B0H17DRAFT_1141917 [Mycena rosella]|uniref:Uncharacterized protein n=1 Tax=Mycena rosella TaxID=1033263 RepID=A0AAD7CYK2_MYCRO|nr:hypothetical protein B0H17DRAFT_1141917 [Mycena rosella]